MFWSSIRPFRPSRCPSWSLSSRASPTSSHSHRVASGPRRISPARCSSCKPECAPRTFPIRPVQGDPDLINGTNQYQFITPLPVLDLIAGGKLRAIAVTAPARMPALPEVATVGEQGFPDLIIQDWFGCW